MALSSSSTFAQIENEYLDTASYLQDNSRALALRHAIAIRYLLFKVPNTSIKGANTVSYNMGLLQDELVRAEEFAKAAATGSRFIRADLSKLRSHG